MPCETAGHGRCGTNTAEGGPGPFGAIQLYCCMLTLLANAFFLQKLLAKIMAVFPSVVAHNIGKYRALKQAFYMTSLDGVEGDYLEFGVYTGSSISAAIEFSKRSLVERRQPVRFFGFDSFKGFGELKSGGEEHPFYKDLNFETSAEKVRRRLSRQVKDRIRVVAGFFDETLKGKQPSDYGIEKASVVMVDCDTYSAAVPAFDFLRPALQEGTIMLIDDFYFYKGSSKLGTYGAFLKFESAHPEWKFRRIFDYGYGGVGMIASKAG